MKRGALFDTQPGEESAKRGIQRGKTLIESDLVVEKHLYHTLGFAFVYVHGWLEYAPNLKKKGIYFADLAV